MPCRATKSGESQEMENTGRAGGGEGEYRWMASGLAGWLLVTAGLWQATPLGFWDAAFTSLLVSLLPILGIVQLRWTEEESVPRLPVYLSSGMVILLVGWGALLAGRRSLGWEKMGLGPVEPLELAAWTGGVSAAAALSIGVFLVLRRRVGLREKPLLSALLPRNRAEKGVFAGLSLAAGLGEELAYRGYLVPVLAGLMESWWGGVVVSSLAFGLAHTYQGPLGVARATVLGALFAGSFVLSGSLLPAVVAHAAVDLAAGLLVGDLLLRN